MKKSWPALIPVIFCFLVFADVKNADKPLKGKWDFRPQKIWEIDSVNNESMERPSELRASQGEMLYFHDFGRGMSHIFDKNGNFIASFAQQGTAAGEVSRYLNCFLAGDKVVIGSPEKLHYYSEEGAYLKSYPNNLFERFPLIFVSENEFLYVPQKMGQPEGEKIKIMSVDLRTGEEKMLVEFPAPTGEKGGPAGPPVVILGLTPQVKIGLDPNARKIYYGRSDDYTIHVSKADGEPLFSFGLDREKKTITQEDKRNHFEESGIPKDSYEKILPFLPGRLTHFMRIQDVGGLIFVYSTENIERQQDRIAIDIFSPEGKYLYRSHLRFGEKMPLYTHVEKVALKGNHCYALLENESGKYFLAKYRISLPPIG